MSASGLHAVERSLDPAEKPELGPQMDGLEPDVEDIDAGKEKGSTEWEMTVPPDVEDVYSEELEEAKYVLENADIEEVEEIAEVHTTIKENLIDRVAYHEIFKQRIGFLDDFKDEYNLDTDEEVIKAFRGEEGFTETIEAGESDGEEERQVSLLFNELDTFRRNREESVFEDENQVADAIISDYYFRGGKGLRSTLALITEYATTGDISFESALAGALIETLHTSTLIQDDDFDDDDERRGRESAPVLNRDFHGRHGELLSMLDGNEMEAWTNMQNVISFSKGLPEDAQYAFATAQEKVNQGQRSDMLMEGDRIEEGSIQDYEDMTVEKTGYIFATAVKMVLDKVKKREDEKPGEMYQAFDEYIENFNYAFQGMDDFLEAFEEINKSDTDIPNRKNTFPAINTYQRLKNEQQFEQEDVRLGEFFRYFFNKEWDELGSYQDWHRETAEALNVELPYTDSETDEVIQRLMNEYGEDVSERQLTEYAATGANALEEVEDELTGRGSQLLQRFINYMPQRAL